ncbi:TIGR01620 family protein [Simiduia sp. 21SJ11W-1]|uniref:YcjF family protein n=1 Tax=Simiduia sp. 21SJ11W-1 TaxID=2909669 RepID=UPI0020A1405D|nr:YcjF family protein [Simiduia sp. 21SJ11W-1]UTA47898.1 TIGR01620 family protein [Simiduia sp. 21SJ11W-1]
MSTNKTHTQEQTQSPWITPLSEAEKKGLQPTVVEAETAPEWEPAISPTGALAYAGIAKAAGVFVLVFVALQAAVMVGGAWSVHWLLGVVAATLVGLPGGWLLQKLWRARRNSRRVDELAKLRLKADVIAAGGAGFGDYAKGVTRVAPALAPVFEGQPARLGDYANDAERLADLDKQLQHQQDPVAHRAIVRATRRSAITVAASPFLALDVFIVLASNLTLVGRIAGAYGLPASPFLAAKLLVQVYRQIAALGAIELGTELASETLSHALLTRLSGRVAQGFSAGLYTYRIGVTAMALCRPLSFSEASKPRSGALFKDIFKQLEGEDALS